MHVGVGVTQDLDLPGKTAIPVNENTSQTIFLIPEVSIKDLLEGSSELAQLQRESKDWLRLHVEIIRSLSGKMFSTPSLVRGA